MFAGLGVDPPICDPSAWEDQQQDLALLRD